MQVKPNQPQVQQQVKPPVIPPPTLGVSKTTGAANPFATGIVGNPNLPAPGAGLGGKLLING